MSDYKIKGYVGEITIRPNLDGMGETVDIRVNIPYELECRMNMSLPSMGPRTPCLIEFTYDEGMESVIIDSEIVEKKSTALLVLGEGKLE